MVGISNEPVLHVHHTILFYFLKLFFYVFGIICSISVPLAWYWFVIPLVHIFMKASDRPLQDIYTKNIPECVDGI